MINKIECVIIECNICGDIFEDRNGFSIWPDASRPSPQDYDWHVDDDTHYCPSCHTIDDEDNLIVKTENKKP